MAFITTRALIIAVATTASAFGYFCTAAHAGPLDEMSEDRWKKLREAEFYQMKVAEKFYRAKQYKVAADEFEKFLKLYDRSEGASFAQLLWSHCQVELRNQNTAIKDGYQSVLDYYPDSPEAPLAALLLGRTLRGKGDIKLAKAAYAKAIAAYPKHFVAVMARLDMVEIAAKDNDIPTQTAMLRELTFDVERKGPTVEPCAQAARMLARLLFRAGNFDEGLKVFATNYKDEDFISHLMHPSLGALPQIVSELTGSADEATKKLGEKLTDASAAWLKVQASKWVTDEKLKPRGIEAWYAIAEIRRHARQPDKQKAIFEEMTKTLGTDDVLLSHIAGWYRDNKLFDKVHQTYAQFKDAARGQALLADCYWRYERNYDKAIAIYRELLVADAKNAKDYAYQIAETLYHANRWTEAIAAYRGLEPTPHTYERMAQAQRQLKNYPEAIRIYTQIMVGFPQSASSAMYQIAATHEQAGKPEEAIKWFKQVCDKHPKTTEGSQAHAHLNEKYKISVTLGGNKD